MTDLQPGLIVFIASLVGALIGYVTNQLPVMKRKPTRVHVVSYVMSILVLCGVAASVALSRGPDDSAPLARFEAQTDNQAVTRPQWFGISLLRPVPREHTVWLAYQNELGGAYVVQASACVESAGKLDCGPVYLGSDANDKNSFRVLIFSADRAATATLLDWGKPVANESGKNTPHAALPHGTDRRGEIHGIRLVAGR